MLLFTIVKMQYCCKYSYDPYSYNNNALNLKHDSVRVDILK